MPAEEWFIVSLLLTFQRAQVHHKEEDIVCLHCYRVTRHQPPALTRSSRLHLALCVNIKRLTLAWCLLHPKSGFLFISLCIHISSSSFIFLLSNIQNILTSPLIFSVIGASENVSHLDENLSKSVLHHINMENKPQCRICNDISNCYLWYLFDWVVCTL